MAKKPTYEDLEQKVKELEKEALEHKRAEQTLKESHDRFVLLLDSLDAAMYVTDIDTYEILFMNTYIKNLFGDRVGEICWKAFHHGQSGPVNSAQMTN